MKKERDYIEDITEIRSMMERSAKFLSLSGWEGILAGIYALSGVFIAYTIFDFNPDKIVYNSCLLYTSDAADERSSVDLGGRRIIKKKNNKNK